MAEVIEKMVAAGSNKLYCLDTPTEKGVILSTAQAHGIWVILKVCLPYALFSKDSNFNLIGI